MVFFGITCMVFCYKFRTFAEFWYFFLAKCRGRLIHRYSRTCNFLAKKQGVDLYTGSTYIPENTVHVRERVPRKSTQHQLGEKSDMALGKTTGCSALSRLPS